MHITSLVKALHKKYTVDDSSGEYRGTNPVEVKNVKQLAVLKREMFPLQLGEVEIVVALDGKSFAAFKKLENVNSFFLSSQEEQEHKFENGRKEGTIFGMEVRAVHGCCAIVAVLEDCIVGYQQIKIHRSWWTSFLRGLGEIMELLT